MKNFPNWVSPFSNYFLIYCVSLADILSIFLFFPATHYLLIGVTVNHLDYLGVEVAWVTGPWFLTIFMNMLPWESGQFLLSVLRRLFKLLLYPWIQFSWLS